MIYLQMTILRGKMVIKQYILGYPVFRQSNIFTYKEQAAQRFSCQKQLGNSFTSLRKRALLRRTAPEGGRLFDPSMTQ